MFKVIWNVVKQIFGVVLWVLSPLKRAVCGRKRKNSDTILPLTGHYPSVEGLSPMNGTADVNILLLNTVKQVLSSHLKIDKAEIVLTNGSLIKVKSIAKCSPRPLKKKTKNWFSRLMQVKSIAEAPMGAFCNTFDLH